MGEWEQERGYWERNAARYDRAMRLLDGPLPHATAWTAAAVEGSGRVLEVAAGTGLFSVEIAPRVGELVATDYAEAMVRRVRAKVEEAGLENVRCEVADLTALPYAPGSFDAVVAANVLHLVPDAGEALRSLRGVLRPGGKLVVPTFCHGESWRTRLLSRLFGLTGFPGHRRLSTASLRGLVEAEGFRVVRAESIPGLFPIGYVEARKEDEKE